MWATSTQGIRGANAPARSSLESIPSNAPRGRGKGRGTTQLETPRTNLRPTKRATRTRQQGEPPSSLTSIGVEMRELNSAYDDASTGESFPNVDSAPVYSGTHFWGSASGT